MAFGRLGSDFHLGWGLAVWDGSYIWDVIWACGMGFRHVGWDLGVWDEILCVGWALGVADGI